MRRAIFGLVLFLMFASLSCRPAKQDIVAKVNGVPIKRSEFVQSLVRAAGKQTLNEMVDIMLIVQEAKKAKIEVTEEEIDKRLEELRKETPSKEMFDRFLSSFGISRVRDQIKSQLIAEKIVKPTVKVTEEEVLQYHKRNLEKVRLSEILVTDEKLAQEILEKLKAGADFAQLATQYTLNPVGKEKGGELGPLTRAELLAEVARVAFELEPKKISDLIRSSWGYHIIRVEEKIPAPALSEEDKEKLRKELLQTKLMQGISTWFAQLKAGAKIEILDENLK